MKRVISLGFITPLIIILTFFSALGQGIPAQVEQQAYLIGPGDEVAVKVLGEPQFDFNATIDDEGMIQVPFFENRLEAKCKTEKELRISVEKLMSKYLRTPMVSLRVADRKSRPPVSVIGEVKQPQGVILVRPTRLLELLSFVGDVTEDAAGMVQVFHTKAPACASAETMAAMAADKGTPYRLYSLTAIKSGKEDVNPTIYPGDVVVVQKAAPIYITGEVRSPQGVRLSELGTSLTQAIAMVGGINREAKSSNVKVYRLKPDKTDRETLVADLKMIKAGKQEDIMLQPYDIVEVDKAKKNIAEAILELAIGAGKSAMGSVTGGIGYRVLY